MRESGPFRIEECGFQLVNLRSALKYDEFWVNDKVQSVYIPEVGKALKRELGAKYVHVLDYAVRKRHQSFPVSTGEEFQYDQPTALAHIDFTAKEGERIIRVLFGNRAEEVLKGRWQAINVWKPIKGPLDDWPLGLCDARSVDFANDTIAGDIVFDDFVTENLQIFPSPNFQWYYVPDQNTWEALMFKSADSDETAVPDATIHDARPLNPTIEENGFTLTSFPTEMSYQDYADREKISTIYAPELEKHLRDLFQAPHVKVIDYAVRRRHPSFPVSTGMEYVDQQPARLVHVDFSHEEARKMLQTLYGDNAREILQHRWQIVKYKHLGLNFNYWQHLTSSQSTWKPLKGPLFDWPLAVGDAQTFDAAHDYQISDVVYPEWAYENVLVHARPGQKWYYFHALEDSETMVFKCTDSDARALQYNPRESIESRAFIIWAPLEELPDEVGSVYGERT
ncbi:hypothetical protein MKX08_007661 [Trichoderma sp. CBMAI-0020]|nr:hypothetical protein MKX08_007661 [Trichoderma sp. CBMAI-0020]